VWRQTKRSIYIYVTPTNGQICAHADEAERSLHDALAVLYQTIKDTRVVYGGGACEMWMAHAVDDLACKAEGKKSIAIEAFSKALRQIPTIILDNGGYDAAEVVGQLRALHTKGQKTTGIGRLD
jgi:T-complex protein 1 subunit beta